MTHSVPSTLTPYTCRRTLGRASVKVLMTAAAWNTVSTPSHATRHVAHPANVPDDARDTRVALERCKVERADLAAELEQTAHEMLAHVAVAARHQADGTDLIGVGGELHEPLRTSEAAC